MTCYGMLMTGYIVFLPGCQNKYVVNINFTLKIDRMTLQSYAHPFT